MADQIGKATPGKRYCWACEVYMSARVCKACGMPTERVPQYVAEPERQVTMGMGKDAARVVLDRGTLTWGDLKRMLRVAAPSADDTPAHLNAGLTKRHAHDIFTAALKDYDDATRIDGRSSRNFLMASNVLREFGNLNAIRDHEN